MSQYSGSRSIAIIVVRDGVLPSGADETAAEAHGHVLIIGTNTQAAQDDLAGLLERVVRIESHGQPQQLAHEIISVWPNVCEQFDPVDVVLTSASADGRDIAPHLAAGLGWDFIGGVIDIDEPHFIPEGSNVLSSIDAPAVALTPRRFITGRHGSQVRAVHQIAQPVVATLVSGTRGVPTPTMTLQSSVDLTPHVNAEQPYESALNGSVTTVAVLEPDASTMDLAESPRILGGGAGLNGHEQFDQLNELAALLDASVGATRVITDRGWIPHERQIGTTGVVVNPRLYLAFGISGAIQHTAGLGQPDHIVSVNTDEFCPMMELADLAVVGDANEIVAELIALLKAQDVVVQDVVSDSQAIAAREVAS